MINIQENILLKDFTTFKIGGSARYFAIVMSVDELKEIVIFLRAKKVPFFVLGGGSNILISDKGYDGLVIKNEIKGRFTKDMAEAGSLVTFGAGENWDEAVAYSISKDLFGLENLSGIPGTVGASPVQNIGAYGQEIKNVLSSVKVIDMESGEEIIFNNADCYFSYRDSIFKKEASKKYIITEVSFLLRKDSQVNISYKDLQLYFLEKTNLKPILGEVREAVLQIRSKKFPSLIETGLAGSFFKNPIISQEKFNELKVLLPALPGFPEVNEKVKVPLAWILDNVCQLKGYREGNVGLYDKQPIILVNYDGATEKEVSVFAKKIVDIVKNKIDLDIEWEVELVK
jgi:UDP-N-acetylmuramate dehydrogenase